MSVDFDITLHDNTILENKKSHNPRIIEIMNK